MNMNKALILGCSHAAGTEITRDHLYGLEHSYPVKIAEQLGYTAVNLAISGGSNDAMFRIFTEQLSTLDESDIVIACWTGTNRTEVWNDTTNRWVTLVPGGQHHTTQEYINCQRNWIVHHTDEVSGRLNKIKNIVSLNSLAVENNIKVMNINSFWPITDIVWPKQVKWATEDNFLDWCRARDYPTTAESHFYEPAHQAFAEHVRNTIPL